MSANLRWIIANDHAGLPLKPELLAALSVLGITPVDLGVHTAESVDYPDYAHRLAGVIAEGNADRGVLVCGSGIGVSIAANRHRGVRAALCGDVFSARMARLHNDANVICLGARVVGPGLAREIVSAFATTGFEGDRHLRRVKKIEPGGE